MIKIHPASLAIGGTLLVIMISSGPVAFLITAYKNRRIKKIREAYNAPPAMRYGVNPQYIQHEDELPETEV
jgi:hypothetical protein